ncbi:MAG: hypothetical protein WC879_17750 [Melioribacteraceae bacterium]
MRKTYFGSFLYWNENCLLLFDNELEMILVSINTTENFCEINIYHRMMKVDLVKKLKMKNNSHWRTITIFASVVRGIFILFKRIALSPVAKNTV